MANTPEIVPFCLRNAPALIESVLPVQRISVDSYKEQMAVHGKTLTSLGAYWKGRKPLVLNRACVLASLLPATANPKRDLEIFEMLMSMDMISISKRKGLPKPDSLARSVNIEDIHEYFTVSPPEAAGSLPDTAPFDVLDYQFEGKEGRLLTPTLRWRKDVSEDDKHRLAAQMLPAESYKTLSAEISRAEDILQSVHTHVWPAVNGHLKTNAHNFPELVEQLGIMRFGHRPVIGDPFSGSGQIPYEAARLGCDVYAADLNPVACLLTWGAFNVVGASPERQKQLDLAQVSTISGVRAEIDALGVETDGNGWRARVFLYCLEATCPTSGWKVPLLSSRVLSKSKKAIVDLIPDPLAKRYEILVRSGVSERELKAAAVGTYREESVIHEVEGIVHRNRIGSIRGDQTVEKDGKKIAINRVRQWKSDDVTFQREDVFFERLYAINWIQDNGAVRPEMEFRGVTAADLQREELVTSTVLKSQAEWRQRGWIPDMKIEEGGPPRYQGRSLIQNFGWTHWQHLFNPRQLLIGSLVSKHSTSGASRLFLARFLNRSSRLCMWDPSVNAGAHVFYNQALNGLMNYASRGFTSLENFLNISPQESNSIVSKSTVFNGEASKIDSASDIFITDPPYGDAVKYEEIFDFFVSWLRANPPKELSHWIWDSRRAMAIKGENHDFKIGMVAAYKRMTECMPDNGLQIIMFTHQSGSIWADMANIVWASGLKVTAAWYVVTETDSALREGQYVKGTILLVLRKRPQDLDTARDELAYELAEEVKTQVDLLTGLNKGVKELYRDENLFEDADLQMAGYAAALRVLTRYSTIDGVSMPQEAMRPRVKGQTTMVDELIAFAVNIANEYLVPDGVDRAVWEKSTGIERFYLKMLDMESKGIHVLSNYQNFAKAFKVQDYGAVMDEVKANHANLKTAAQLGKRGMTAGEEFGPTVLRSVLYAVHLLQENKVKPEDVLHQLRDLVPDYFRERERITALADYVSKKTAKARPDESSNAMVLRDLVRRERV